MNHVRALLVLPIVALGLALVLLGGFLGGPVMQDALLDALARRRP